MATTTRITSCPQCGTSCQVDNKNPWRPFCSERCKLIDLGDWLDERFRVPVENHDGSMEDASDSEY